MALTWIVWCPFTLFLICEAINGVERCYNNPEIESSTDMDVCLLFNMNT